MRDRILFSLSLLWCLALAVIITFVLAIPLFALEIQGAHLAQIAQMSAQTLWQNFLSLMNYLLNPFVSKLSMPNFPSSASGLKHFSEVKQLVMLGLLFLLFLFPAIFYFFKKNLALPFHHAFRVVLLFPVFSIAIIFLIGFDNFFIYFHEVLFRNQSWVFDPATDPIINVLPEQYFMFAFLLFFLVYELIFFFLYRRGSLSHKTK